MRPIIVASLCGLALAGCASITGPSSAPSCDGYSRRPLNRSMWEWEGAKTAAAVAAPALPAAESDATGPAPASPLLRRGDAGAAGKVAASFDLAASLKTCTGERGHG